MAALAVPLRAQAGDVAAATLPAVAVDAGLLRVAGARSTAAFGLSLDLGVHHLPGFLRLGLSTWIADLEDGSALRGRDLSALWLLRTPSRAGWRLFAGAGPAVERCALGTEPASFGAALAAQAGLQLPLAPREALALELRAGTLAPAGASARFTLGLGIRLAPGAARELLRGEPQPPLAAVEAQAAPPPPNLGDVLASAGGVLLPARSGGGLRLEEVAFDSDGTSLTRSGFLGLAAAGGTLQQLGAVPLHVVIYTGAGRPVDARRASLRAVSVARALARGGYPVGEILLEASPAPKGDDAVGQIVAGSRCLRGCVAPASR